MAAEIKKPRKDRKESQPMTKILQLPIEKRGQLIGPGGMNLRRISSSTGVTISSKDESSFELFAPNSRSMSEADAIINKLLNTPVSLLIKTKVIQIEKLIFQIKINKI